MSTKFEASKRVVDETRRLYDGLLSRPLPAGADKQLARPPFKFIQELVKSLITETRLLRNIFNPMDFDEKRSWSKQMKVDFVQKLIDFIANNKQPVVGCLAAKVVAGLEPNKTNELLQALARLAQKQLNGQLNQDTAATSKRPRTFTKPLNINNKQQQPTTDSRFGSASSRRKSSGGSSGIQTSSHNNNNATKKSSPVSLTKPASPPKLLANSQPSPIESSPGPIKHPEDNSSAAESKQFFKPTRQVNISSESDINKANLLHLKINLKQLKSTLEDVGQMEDSLRHRLANILVAKNYS